MRFSSITIGLALATCCSAVTFAATTGSTQLAQKQHAKINSLQQQITALEKKEANSNAELGKLVNRYHRGSYLYAGLNERHPLAKLPGTSFAVTYLKERDVFTRPLTLSGYIEFDAQAWRGNYSKPVTTTPAYGKGSGLFLTTTKLFALFQPNNWVSFFTDVEAAGDTGNTLTIENAILVFGNLKKTPVYAAVGKFDLAFGVFGGGGPWSSALNNEVFKVGETSQLELGFYKDGLNIAASLFNNGRFSSNADDFVVSAEYNRQWNNLVSTDVGIGYLNDIRGTDSGIGTAYNTNDLTTLNSGKNAEYDVNATVNVGAVSVFGEYNRSQRGAEITTTTAGNLGNTGVMSAWVVATAYKHPIFNKPTTFSVSYSGTHNMANIPMGVSGAANSAIDAPQGFKSDWIASISNEILTNIYLGPEWQYGTLYNNAGHTWTGTLDISAYF